MLQFSQRRENKQNVFTYAIDVASFSRYVIDQNWYKDDGLDFE